MLLTKRQMRLETVDDKIMALFMERHEMSIERVAFQYYQRYHEFKSYQLMATHISSLKSKGFLEKTGVRKYKLVGE
jgi:hypothetical protein